MPELVPFRALRYAACTGSLEDVLAPPYDVIDERLARMLRAMHTHNAVRLVLPEGSEEERYGRAAHDFARWLQQGTLVEDSRPSVTVYRQRFLADSRPLTRLGAFAALRLVPYEENCVLPHEETHAGPRRDRLALTLATRAQLSPVFCLARDSDGSLLEELHAAAARSPAATAVTADGVEHEVWIVRDEGLIDRLCGLLGREPLLIADGHHRYETALEVSRLLPHSPRASYVLAFVVSSGDPGVVIRPTHRALTRPPPGASSMAAWLSRKPPGLRILRLPECPEDARSDTHDDTAGREEGWIVQARSRGRSRAWSVSPHPETIAELGLSEVEGRIAAIAFEQAVLRRFYGVSAEEAAREGTLSYHRDAGRAIAAAGARGGAFVLPPVVLDDVWRCAERGRRLPPKTTYFVPKIPSGLVFRRL